MVIKDDYRGIEEWSRFEIQIQRAIISNIIFCDWKKRMANMERPHELRYY